MSITLQREQKWDGTGRHLLICDLGFRRQYLRPHVTAFVRPRLNYYRISAEIRK